LIFYLEKGLFPELEATTERLLALPDLPLGKVAKIKDFQKQLPRIRQRIADSARELASYAAEAPLDMAALRPRTQVLSVHACSYTPALTRLLLHACSYTPALMKCGAPRFRGLRYCLLSACAEYVLTKALTTFTYAKKEMETKKMRLVFCTRGRRPEIKQIRCIYICCMLLTHFFLVSFFFVNLVWPKPRKQADLLYICCMLLTHFFCFHFFFPRICIPRLAEAPKTSRFAD